VSRFVDIHECQLDIFPFDTDLLSLELENSFKVHPLPVSKWCAAPRKPVRKPLVGGTHDIRPPA
jgi:hypothetical protein